MDDQSSPEPSPSPTTTHQQIPDIHKQNNDSPSTQELSSVKPGKSLKTLLILLPSWAALVTLLLFGFSFVSHSVGELMSFTNKYDISFAIYACVVAVGHVLALVFTTYIFRKSLKLVSEVGTAILLISSVALQLYWRNLSIEINHIDCDFQCGGVVPKLLDPTISWIVLASLVITAVMIFNRIRKKGLTNKGVISVSQPDPTKTDTQ